MQLAANNYAYTDIYGTSFYFLTYTLYSLNSILINDNIGSWFERLSIQFQVIINVISDSSFMDKCVTFRKGLHGLWSSFLQESQDLLHACG